MFKFHPLYQVIGGEGVGTPIVLSRFYWPRGGCRILIKYGIRKFSRLLRLFASHSENKELQRNQIN